MLTTLFPENHLELLPPECRPKPLREEANRDAAHASLNALSDAEFEAANRLKVTTSAVRRSVDRLPQLRLHGMADKEREEALADRTKELEQIEAPLRQARADLDAARVAHRDIAVKRWREYNYLPDCAAWLSRWRVAKLRGGHTELRLVHRAAPFPKHITDYPAAVATAREAIAAKLAEIETIDGASLPAAELVQLATAQIDKIASNSAPDIRFYRRSREPLGPLALADWLNPLLVWSLRDHLIEQVESAIHEADLGLALSDDERDDALATAQAELLALERAEETLVVAAEQRGQHIARRRALDPRAFFEVEEVSK